MNPIRRVSLQAEIRCAGQTPEAVYRIYVGDNLMTERTWVWGSGIGINEHIQINLHIGQGKFRLEPVNCSQSNFTIHNFKINNFLLHPTVRGLETTFVIDAASPPAA
jgi:hypothetical protein